MVKESKDKFREDLENLRKQGLVEIFTKDGVEYVRLTELGRANEIERTAPTVTTFDN